MRYVLLISLNKEFSKKTEFLGKVEVTPFYLTNG